MELEDNKLYLKKTLLAHLKLNGLPHSYPTLLKYERSGEIPSPRNTINSWRAYTGIEIKEITEIFRRIYGK